MGKSAAFSRLLNFEIAIVCVTVFILKFANGHTLSKSVGNFMRIASKKNGTFNDTDIKRFEYPETALDKRGDIIPTFHENWHRNRPHIQIPDFGYHDLHENDEVGESFQLESHPRHHVGHHEPHFYHRFHSYHHGDEHPHIHHEHYVMHEPMHHGYHHGHHSEHHDEESGEHHDHDDHHVDEGEVHGEGDWDVGGGYFQLEEHGSDVNIVAMKKHGTKVHMSGGDFHVIRDPWRHHSLFAGLFHPHEMPGHGQLPMEQFHQHFTYIANDRAINHHTYEHNMNFEDNHQHSHHGHHGGYDDHDKRDYSPNSAASLSVNPQTKQQISEKPESSVLFSIPLKKIALPANDTNLDTRSPKKHDDKDKYKDIRPNLQSLHSQPLYDSNNGPKLPNTVVEIPLSPIFKRQLRNANTLSRDKRTNKADVKDRDRPINKLSKLRRAFSSKLRS